MRRSDREITEFNEIVKVLEACDCVRLAMQDGDVPYIVPLNFGMNVNGEKITLYFHSATEGKKLDLLRAHPRVAFEADCSHRLVSDGERGYCTMEYASVIGRGVFALLTDETERYAALKNLVDRYHPEGFEFNRAAMPRTTVFKIDVESITGKRRQKRN